MERDLGYSFVLSRARDISTHTLTWSVTDVEYGKATDFRISTHTLTWSVTGNNRTAPNVHVSISTHTLTWSVTYGKGKKQSELIFQLTRSRGA